MDRQESNQLVSKESEAAYLGSLLFDATQVAETAVGMERGMFFFPAHQLIFTAIMAVHASGANVEPVLVLEELRKADSLKAAGGADYLMSLLAELPNAASAPDYARAVRDLWQRRTLASALEVIKRQVNESPIDGAGFNAMGLVNKAIEAIGKASGNASMIYLRQVVDESLKATDQQELPTVTRIAKLDGNINLFSPGEMTIVAARPSIGKSSLMRQMVVNGATSGTVLVFSLEVTPKVLTAQLGCELAKVPYWNWTRNKVTDEERERVILATSSGVFDEIAVNQRTNVSALDVSLGIAQAQAQGKKVVAVFIDYLGLMRHDKAERNDLAVGATTRLLKQVALERQVPILLLSQLNREVEKRGGTAECDRPRLADLRDSGNIEQDADNVVFLWRKERGDEFKVVEPRVVSIAKHRNGQCFEVDLMFDKGAGRFYEVNERGLPPPQAEWVSQ